VVNAFAAKHKRSLPLVKILSCAQAQFFFPGMFGTTPSSAKAFVVNGRLQPVKTSWTHDDILES
jgi:hypothetical protein